MKKLHRGLRVLGLTELEAKVYIKLLEMKQARVTKLSNEVGVTRTQLYPLLEKPARGRQALLRFTCLRRVYPPS